MSAYYNENDPKAAAWLRELIREGLIADGEVDTRSIVDIEPSDLAGFVQCHFFAGIGGWSYALRLAGYTDDRACWSGSCPCQPFSSAGKGNGADDSRHLWPTWFELIAECRPRVVFGEQVASADGLGWLDRVSTDLEAADYAIGACDFCAAGVGAFHIRQRLWFVAHTERRATERHGLDVGSAPESLEGRAQERQRLRADARHGGDVGDVGHTASARREPRGAERCQPGKEVERLSSASNPWRVVEWVQCRDGRRRPVEPGTFPLAHGLPARVGRLRGYGNAIVPQVAAEVIGAYMEIVGNG